MSLIEIGKKYPSSKNISGFIQLYEKYFTSLKNLKINILEIGIENGDSLRIWREYFTNANICGIDIDKKDFKINNTEILQGDQSDKNFLKTLIDKYKNFDIIIDDGSHQAKHIIASFKFLFPAKSTIVGSKSEKEIGVSVCIFSFIPGPEIIKGTLMPPSIASHLPLCKG